MRNFIENAYEIIGGLILILTLYIFNNLKESKIKNILLKFLIYPFYLIEKMDKND